MTDTRLLDRYVGLLGAEAGPTSLDHLGRLVRAQLTRVPFENVSKLLLKKIAGAAFIPTLAQHLDGIEHLRFGGTCYANNHYFCELLRHLGYDVDLCGADMAKPDVHIVNIVRLEGREYLVDVGYAAPFFEPMPLHLDRELEIRWGADRYVLHPRDGRGRSRMDLWCDGRLIHGYTVNPAPRELGHFEDVIRRSYDDSATFMNVLVIARFFADRSLRVHNYTLSESTPDGTVITDLDGIDKLVDTVARLMGIEEAILLAAVEGICLSGEIYT